MQVARYWRNKRLLYQLRRNRVQTVREPVESLASERKMAKRRETGAMKGLVA